MDASPGKDKLCRKLWYDHQLRVSVHTMGSYVKKHGAALGLGAPEARRVERPRGGLHPLGLEYLSGTPVQNIKLLL